MLNNIFKSKNILLSNNFWTQNLLTVQRMSDFNRGLIQTPPKKVRYGRTKILFVEERRRLQAEAAERRHKDNEGRGLKDPEGAKRRMEQKAAAAREVETGGEGGMKWQVG
eukprot:GFUD01081847.1.p1 GENE.GFUD01081847.1~~GFUD01081847.1.p1  ORF type:complete len:110 (+),score=35.69 GFUD01081847.1:46-375(+)